MLSARHPKNVGHAYEPTSCLNKQSMEKKGTPCGARVSGLLAGHLARAPSSRSSFHLALLPPADGPSRFCTYVGSTQESSGLARVT